MVVELLPLILIILYLVPFCVAAARDHDDYVKILIANLLLGWTVVGWFGVLLWAFLSPRRHERMIARPELRQIR